MITTTERINDPLLEAVNAYDKARAEFLACDGYDNPEERRFLDSIAILAEWDRPATSLEGAVAAIRHIVDMTGGYEMPDDVAAMAKAALAYFEGKARQ